MCLCLSVCVYICVCACVSMHLYIIVCVVHSQKVAAAVTALSRSSILAKGEGGSGRTPGSVRSTQSRRKILGASPQKIIGILDQITSVK